MFWDLFVMAKTIWREPKREDERNDGHSVGEEGEGSGVGIIAPKDKAEKDDKLEVKHKGAWYAAELSLREDGITKVDFEGYSDDEFVDDDEEWNAEKIKSFKKPLSLHVRVVSKQLQDEDCGLVHVNKVVCALRKAGPNKEQSSEGWYDAVVTAVRKRHHRMEDTGEICTCSFKVVWRDGPDKGQGKYVGCGDICLLSTRDVETHPLIVDILRRADDQGGRIKDQEEVLTTLSAPKKRNREGETDNSIASLEEGQEVRRYKRLKPKSTNLAQVRTEPDAFIELERLVNDHLIARSSPDKGVQDVPSPAQCAEQETANADANNDQGTRKGQEEVELTASIAPEVTRRKKGETDVDGLCSPEERQENIRQFKKFKSKSQNLAQVQSDADVELVRLVNDHFARTSHGKGIEAKRFRFDGNVSCGLFPFQRAAAMNTTYRAHQPLGRQCDS